MEVDCAQKCLERPCRCWKDFCGSTVSGFEMLGGLKPPKRSSGSLPLTSSPKRFGTKTKRKHHPRDLGGFEAQAKTEELANGTQGLEPRVVFEELGD